MSVDVYGGFGTVTIGRLTLREALKSATETSGASGRQLKIVGQEAVPLLTPEQLAAVQDDLIGMLGTFVPVTFTNKSDRNGYWYVTDASYDVMNWNGEVVTVDWQLTLDRGGTDTEIDIESRLSGSLARQNVWGATGVRNHVPPIGHYAYFSGATQPDTLVRTGSDGAMLVYRNVPTDVNPRWGCPVSAYMGGRVRFLDSHDIERSGVTFSVRPTNPPVVPATTLTPATTLVTSSGAADHWTLTNGLVKITPAPAGSGTLIISAYTGGDWHDKYWDVLLGGVSVGTPDTVSVLRNEPEIVVVRLLRTAAPGRSTIDLTLRRGFRIVEIYVQNSYSTTMKLAAFTPEAGNASSSGYLRATSNDGDGNRYVVGSASTFTTDTVNGSISATSVVGFDAFIGVEAGGLSALAGDQAADLFSSYLGAPAETIQAVRR